MLPTLPPPGAGRVGPGRRADAFKDAAADVADVMLPIAPFTETAGTFVNAEGRAAGFHGVVKPLGDARPAWKVLRVLGNLLGLPGFDQDSATSVRRRPWVTGSTLAERLDNAQPGGWPPPAPAGRPGARGRRAHLCRRRHRAPRLCRCS
jgi:NADH-quinone oxidoreductase subunit G